MVADRFHTPKPHYLISSPRNARVRAVAELRKRRAREAQGRFVGEGGWVLRMALDAGVTPLEVLFAPELLSPREIRLIGMARGKGATLVQVSEPALRRVSFRDDPEGILTVFSAMPTGLDRILVKEPPLILIVETIEKPGNLGSMLRTACAAGVDAVVVCDPQTDVFGPGVVRASLGTLFSMPMAVCESPRAIEWLRSMGVSIVAATPRGEKDLWNTDLRGGLAIAIGNEHRGLSSLWMEASDLAVRIPMTEAINSLNATMAAGVLLYEAVRQRRGS